MLSIVEARLQTNQKFIFNTIDERDGLSTVLITDMVVDSIDFVWIATYYGINRYDGKNVKIFNNIPGDSTSLLHNKGQRLYVDYKGNLWVGYTMGGLSMLEKGKHTFKHFGKDSTLQVLMQSDIIPLYVDTLGNIWFSGYGKSLCCFNIEKNRITQYDIDNVPKDLPENQYNNSKRIDKLYVDKNGCFWIIAPLGIYKYVPGSKKLEYCSHEVLNMLNRRNITYINGGVWDKKNGFWLTSWGLGMFYYDLSTQKTYNYKYAIDAKDQYRNLVNDIFFKNESELWISTSDSGLGIFNIETKIFNFLKNKNALDENVFKDTRKIVSTKAGVLYVVDNQGVLYHNPHQQLFHFTDLVLPQKQNKSFLISSLFEDTILNKIYFATVLGNGLCVLDKKNNNVKSYPVKILNPKVNNSSAVYDLYNDIHNDLWVLSSDFLYRFDKKNEKLIEITSLYLIGDTTPKSAYRSFIKDKKTGDRYILNMDGQLRKLDIQKQKLLLPINMPGTDTLQINDIMRACSDTNGNMWVIGEGKFGYISLSDNKFHRIRSISIEMAQKHEILSMLVDINNQLWMAVSDSGIVKINIQNPNKIVTHWITPQNGLPTNRMFRMASDKRGYIWITTYKDLVMYNPNDSLYTFYNQSSGISNKTVFLMFNSLNNGDFYITLPAKYCKVDYDKIFASKPLPINYFDKMQVGKRIIELPSFEFGEVTLSAQENFFSLYYGIIEHTGQAYNKVGYILEGWDNDWLYAENTNSITYNNVSGGNYILRLKTANAQGLWSKEIKLKIHILTPFYKSTYFLILIASLISVIIFCLYRIRIKQIRKTEKLKRDFEKQIAESRMEALRAQMNPHFIFNCLNSINRYIIKNDIKTSSLYLTRFAKLMRLVLDNSKHKKIPFSSELEVLELYIQLEAFRFEQKFSYIIQVDNKVEKDLIKVPPLIIQPYVENAIWHGLIHKEHQGVLKITVFQKDDYLDITIEDNGIGRKKAQEFKQSTNPTRKSIGMKLTEERINHQQRNDSNNATEIIDLYDEHGNASGTLVKIKLYF